MGLESCPVRPHSNLRIESDLCMRFKSFQLTFDVDFIEAK